MKINRTFILISILYVVALSSSLYMVDLIQAKDTPSDDPAKIQKYHERRNVGRALSEKWSKGNLSGPEKDELLRTMAFEMYGIDGVN